MEKTGLVVGQTRSPGRVGSALITAVFAASVGGGCSRFGNPADDNRENLPIISLMADTRSGPGVLLIQVHDKPSVDWCLGIVTHGSLFLHSEELVGSFCTTITPDGEGNSEYALVLVQNDPGRPTTLLVQLSNSSSCTAAAVSTQPTSSICPGAKPIRSRAWEIGGIADVGVQPQPAVDADIYSLPADSGGGEVAQ